jgi:Uncharacterised nucleotidyltransferase
VVAERTGLDAATTEAFDVLDAARVDALLLKGPALAHMLYRAGEQRSYCDIDVLVSAADLAPAGAVLAGMGYTNVSEPRGVIDVAGVVHAHTWSRLTPDSGHVMIDLHWSLPGCAASSEIVWKALGKHRSAIVLGARALPTLAAPGLALHVALHSAQHGPSDPKAMADLERGLARWPAETWNQAQQLARELQATEAFTAGLRLLPEGVALAGELGLPDADGLLWMIAHREERPRGTFHLQALAGAPSWREKIVVVRHALVPTRAWIAWEYPRAAEGGLRLLSAYGQHIARAPVWAAKAWRFGRRARQVI